MFSSAGISKALLTTLLSAWCFGAVALAADYRIDLQSAADLDEVVQRNLNPVSRTRFSQLLSLRGHRLLGDDADSLRFVLQMRVLTDFQRLFAESSDDPREQEAVDLVLQLAYVEALAFERLSLRAGRQVVYGGLPPVDADGGRLEWASDFGLQAALVVGREVRHDPRTVDGGAFDAIASRWTYFDDPDPPSTWMGQIDLAWGAEVVGLRFAHRLTFREANLHDHLSGLTGRAAAGPVWSSLRAVLNHRMASFDQVDVQVGLDLPSEVRLALGWRVLRPTFDLDSIWGVFGVTPSVGWRLSAEVRPTSPLRLTAEATLRAYDLAGEVPWGGGLAGGADEIGFGGAVRSDLALMPALRLRIGFGAEGGYAGALVDTDGGVSWLLPAERLELGARVRYAYRDDGGDFGEKGHLVAARWRGTYQLSSFGSLHLYVDYVADYTAAARVRGMVAAEFNLPP